MFEPLPRFNWAGSGNGVSASAHARLKISLRVPKSALDTSTDPVSMFDDKVRLAMARSIYGYPTLNKYAIDPAKPIRIVAQNGT